MSVMSEASSATSAPVPMAMPRSAWASAGASLMPSPTMATTRAAGLELLDLGGLLGRQHLGQDAIRTDADLRADRHRRSPGGRR